MVDRFSIYKELMLLNVWGNCLWQPRSQLGRYPHSQATRCLGPKVENAGGAWWPVGRGSSCVEEERFHGCIDHKGSAWSRGVSRWRVWFIGRASHVRRRRCPVRVQVDQSADGLRAGHCGSRWTPRVSECRQVRLRWSTHDLSPLGSQLFQLLTLARQ